MPASAANGPERGLRGAARARPQAPAVAAQPAEGAIACSKGSAAGGARRDRPR